MLGEGVMSTSSCLRPVRVATHLSFPSSARCTRINNPWPRPPVPTLRISPGRILCTSSHVSMILKSASSPSILPCRKYVLPLRCFIFLDAEECITEHVYKKEKHPEGRLFYNQFYNGLVFCCGFNDHLISRLCVIFLYRGNLLCEFRLC